MESITNLEYHRHLQHTFVLEEEKSNEFGVKPLWILKICDNFTLSSKACFTHKNQIMLSNSLHVPKTIKFENSIQNYMKKHVSRCLFISHCPQKKPFSLFFLWVWKPIQDVGHIWQTPSWTELKGQSIMFKYYRLMTWSRPIQW